MKNFKSYFMFSKEHRSGIFLLFFCIIVFQIFWYSYDFSPRKKEIQTKEEKQWLALKNEIDSIKHVNINKKNQIKPFNPNFISDYKGSVLGMSIAEIDRLHSFRAQNKYVNSIVEFQQVTKVSNELLHKISPYFKFPDWVKNKSITNVNFKNNSNLKEYQAKKEFIKKDINTASKEEIMDVFGIGDKISDIILLEREKFGAFASLEQLSFIWGVTPEAFQDIQKRFFIGVNKEIIKIDINNSSIKELSRFPYFNYYIAKNIVTFRSMNGDFKNIEELTKIKEFPVEKLNIIALYLEF